MCLFKVYLEERGSKKLIAEGISAVEKIGSQLKLFNPALQEVATVEKAEIVRIDTLNELLLLRR